MLYLLNTAPSKMSTSHEYFLKSFDVVVMTKWDINLAKEVEKALASNS